MERGPPKLNKGLRVALWSGLTICRHALAVRTSHEGTTLNPSLSQRLVFSHMDGYRFMAARLQIAQHGKSMVGGNAVTKA
jgi:hypothetical protein